MHRFARLIDEASLDGIPTRAVTVGLAVREDRCGTIVRGPAVVGGAALGLKGSGVSGGASGFMIGNFVAAIAICPLAFRVALAQRRAPASLIAEVMR